MATSTDSPAGTAERGAERRSLASRAFVAAAAVLPAAFLAWLLFRFTVDVPLLDQWFFPADIEHYRHGQWTLAELVRSQNGHRLLVPRLILVPLASWTGWNTRVEVLVGFLLALATGAIWWRATRALRDRLSTLAAAALAFLLSFAQFSLSQYENWLWGLQMHVFLAVLGVSAGLRLAAEPALPPRRSLGAAGAGIVAAFSHATGLLFWWVLPVTLALRRPGRRPAWRRLGALAAFAVALSALYFVKLPQDRLGGSEGIASGFDPVRVAYFALTLLGAPVAGPFGSAWPERDLGIGWALGLSSLILWLMLAAREVRRGKEGGGIPGWKLWILTLPLYSIGAALLSALGRAKSGGAIAFSSRYVTLATPFWMGLAVLLFLAADRTAEPRRAVRIGARAALALIFAGLLASSAKRLEEPRMREKFLSRSRIALAQGGPDALLANLHRGVQHVRAALPILERERLSVFRPGESIPPRLAEPTPLAGYGQRLAWSSPPAASVLRVGAVRTLRVVAANSSAVPWPAIGEDVHGARSVRLSYRWFTADGAAFVADGPRADLSRDLAPGAEEAIDLCVEPPPAPGRYRLRLSMLQEGVAWFDDRGAPGLELAVEVTPSSWSGPGRALRRLAWDVGLAGCG